MVSEISLGTWGVYEGTSSEKMKRILFTALDLGVNLIDTSNSYASGQAELFLGQTLKDVPRSSVILATKVFFPVIGGEGGLSAKEIKENIESSLSRLGVDYIDLYQCHRFDPNTPLEETMGALSDIVAEGKALYIGFSEWTPAQIMAALQIDDAVSFISSQPQYSMLWRHPEAEVFPLCNANGIGQIVWSPLAQGILSGKYEAGQEPKIGTRAANAKMNGYLLRELYSDSTLRIVQQLTPLAKSLGLTMPQFALAWVLQKESVASAIIGASRPEQVVENIHASGIVLEPAVMNSVDEILSPILTNTMQD